MPIDFAVPAMVRVAESRFVVLRSGSLICAMARSFEAGTSALFVLVRRVNLDKVLPELKPFGGTVVKTSLTNEQERRLKNALEDATAEAAVPA